MAKTIELKYGCNPHQKTARLTYNGAVSPLRVLNGAPSYISILDSLGAWQVARELRAATGLPGAASFKHVSPAGAAVGKPLTDVLREVYMVGDLDLSPLATAYARARGADRLCSFGDVIGLSDVVDEPAARLIKMDVSDIVIAPGYEPAALEILKAKKKGGFIVLQIDPSYEPPEMESREVFGFRLEQSRNAAAVGPQLLENVVSKRNDLDDAARMDLLVATVTVKYTQSNSVTVAYDGQVVGNGAGQQSRVHCTRLACSKADKWMLLQHPRVRGLEFRDGAKRTDITNAIDQFLLWDELSPPEAADLRTKLAGEPEPLTREERAEWIAGFQGLSLSSDAFFPFRDSLDRANRSGVRFVIHPGQSIRDDEVTRTADEYGMTMIHSGIRWFLH